VNTVREFRLGFAAGRLKRYLAFRGWSDELAADLGLIDSREREWYRGRLVIPEMRGDHAIYLVGRTIPGARGAFGPKYLTLAGVPKPRGAGGATFRPGLGSNLRPFRPQPQL
jgi:hypothetical protein